MVSYGVSLQQALEAKSRLEELQTLASLAPVLQQQEDKAQSEKHLEEVRKAILAENTVLYSQFQEAISEYRNELDTIVDALKHLAGTLRNVFTLRKRLSDNAGSYVHSYYEHLIKHNRLDALQASFQAENKVNDCLPGSLQFEPSKANDPITGSIATILSHL